MDVRQGKKIHSLVTWDLRTSILVIITHASAECAHQDHRVEEFHENGGIWDLHFQKKTEFHVVKF